MKMQVMFGKRGQPLRVHSRYLKPKAKRAFGQRRFIVIKGGRS